MGLDSDASPLRGARPHKPVAPATHKHHDRTEAAPSGGNPAPQRSQAPESPQNGSPWVDLTIRASHPDLARPAVESFLDRETKRWRLEGTTQEANGAVALRYAVRPRKRTPRDQFLEQLRALASSQGFTVEALSASVPEPVAVQGAPGGVALPRP